MTDRFAAELGRLSEKGLLRRTQTFEASDGRTITAEGKRYLLFCSNDYFGLSLDSRVLGAVQETLAKFGFGSGGSRLISGTRTPHTNLERKLAEYLAAPAVLCFSSGYSANTGLIPALTGRGDAILADRLNHASLIDGALLSDASLHRYPHRDMAALERLLKKTATARERWIITDGIFSMDGDLAPLDDICGLAKKYGAKTYVDDAHAFGILGPQGRGTPALFGVEKQIDLCVGTFGKAAGGMGAFAAGSKTAIDFLMNRTRSYIFSTAMPPAVAAGNLKGVEILTGFDEERKAFLEITETFHNDLKRLDFDVPGKSYILPIIIGDAEEASRSAESFWNRGIYLQAVRPPAVPEGASRLRLTLSLLHTDEDRKMLLDAMRTIVPGMEG